MAVYQLVMLVFAVLMLAGGAMGHRAGSKASLIAGSVSAVAMLIALLVSMRYGTAGIWAGAVIALLLSISFARRLAATKKLMPSGMLMLLSLATCGILAFYAAG